MYFEYAKERESLDSITSENGFALYRKDKNTLFIRDIYVKPEFRKTSEFLNLFKRLKKIAEELNCKYMEGHVYLDTKDPTLSLRAILSAGFKVVHASNGMIALTKEI